MAYARTLGELTASVRELGDYQEVTAATDFISGPFLVRRVAANYKHSYELVADADADRLTTTTEITVTSATGSFPEPTDIWRLREVAVSDGGDRWVPLTRQDPSPGYIWTDESWATSLPGTYRYEGDHIFVSPSAAAGSTFRISYIPAPPTLTGTLDPVIGIGGADELVVWQTLRDCRERESASTVECDTQIDRETKRLNNSARDRDRGQPMRMEPVGGGWNRRRR